MTSSLYPADFWPVPAPLRSRPINPARPNGAAVYQRLVHRALPYRFCLRGFLHMETTASTLGEIKCLVAETLGITDRLGSMDASTGLIGVMPELDSMGVVELLVAIEDKFGLHIDDAAIQTDAFETLGALAAYVDAHRP